MVGRGRKIPRAAVIAATALATLALAAPAGAGSAIRLDGRFDVIARITSANDGTSGTVALRIYRFTSLCDGTRACSRVALRRQGSRNSHYSSILKRRTNGSYRGVEVDRQAGCGSGVGGEERVYLSFYGRRPDNGLATAFTGRARFVVRCEGQQTIRERARLTGTLR